MVKVKDLVLIHKTRKGEQIMVKKGSLSEFDFRVYYIKNGLKVPRSPKHSHLTIDLYIKYGKNPKLTMKMVERFRQLLDLIQPINYFPPKFQFFKQSDTDEFKELDSVGIFSAEFLMAYEELMIIQEKTNYAPMTFHRNLLNSFGTKDIYSVINTATQSGKKK
jgi:hypothetical protein